MPLQEQWREEKDRVGEANRGAGKGYDGWKAIDKPWTVGVVPIAATVVDLDSAE